MKKSFLYTMVFTLMLATTEADSFFLTDAISYCFNKTIETVVYKPFNTACKTIKEQITEPLIENTVKLSFVAIAGLSGYTGARLYLGTSKNIPEAFQQIKKALKENIHNKRVVINLHDMRTRKFIPFFIGALASYVTWRLVYPDEIHKELKKTNANLDLVKKDVSEIKEDVKKISTNVVELQKKLDTANTTLEDIKKEVAKANPNIEEINKKMTNFEKSLKNLPAEVKKQFDVDFKNINEAIKKNNTKDLKNQIDQLSLDIVNFKNDLKYCLKEAIQEVISENKQFSNNLPPINKNQKQNYQKIKFGPDTLTKSNFITNNTNNNKNFQANNFEIKKFIENKEYAFDKN